MTKCLKIRTGLGLWTNFKEPNFTTWEFCGVSGVSTSFVLDDVYSEEMEEECL